MRARAQATLPKGGGWAFEPKWDGFRAIAWSGGRLDSRRKRPLLHYFPELAAALVDLPPDTVLDGEIIVPIAGVCELGDRPKLLASTHLPAFDLHRHS